MLTNSFKPVAALATLIALLFIPASLVWGQAKASTQRVVPIAAPAPAKKTAADFLPGQLGDSVATRAVELLNQTSLVLDLGDNLDLAREFGLTSAARREYRVGDLPLTVSLYRLEQASKSYGFYRALVGSGPKLDSYGPQGTITPAGLFLWRGANLIHVASISPVATGETQSAIKHLADSLVKELGGGLDEAPRIMAHLPEKSMVSGSDRYLVGPAGAKRFAALPAPIEVNFTGGTEVATGNYDIKGQKGELLIIEYQTPQLATQDFEQLQNNLQALPPDQRQRFYLKREGNYAVAAVGFNDPAVAQNLADQVKYTYKIKWLGKQPPPPLDYSAYRREALNLIIAIFVAVGIVVIFTVVGGVIFGGSLFIRRRGRLNQVFSDAGGMVRLNLDELVPQTLHENKQRLLGKGE